MVEDRTPPTPKVIANCVYCPNPPDGEEHWLNRSQGKFAGNTLLIGRICTPCNEDLGRTVDQAIAREGPTGMFRQVLGIQGRPGHQKSNVFDYKASHVEPPLQAFQVGGENETPVFQDVVGLNSDGTLKAIEGRSLTVKTADGQEHTLRFPAAWGEAQLQGAVEARGLLGAQPVRAHVRPPETLAEFQATSTSVIRAVFGPFEMDLLTTDIDSPSAPVVQTRMRFNLSRDYLRGVAKIAFHYFLWACPQIGGDELEFAGVKAFIRSGAGDAADFIQLADSTVDRIETDAGGPGDHGHAFASLISGGDELLVQLHFYSLNVGPSLSTFLVRLGPRPSALSSNWLTTHIAAIRDGVEGHDGVLKDLLTDEDSQLS
ncbi:MAG: hypothetical protein AAB403_22795 [Planctomycetota bacterium]